MSLDVIKISNEHKLLLKRLSRLIPDLDLEDSRSLRRIFGLGLIALTTQVVSKSREEGKAELVEELVATVKEMILGAKEIRYSTPVMSEPIPMGEMGRDQGKVAYVRAMSQLTRRRKYVSKSVLPN